MLPPSSLFMFMSTLLTDWTDYYRLVLPYRTFYMIATTEAEAEDWLTFLRWRLVSQLLRNLWTKVDTLGGDIALFPYPVDT